LPIIANECTNRFGVMPVIEDLVADLNECRGAPCPVGERDSDFGAFADFPLPSHQGENTAPHPALTRQHVLESRGRCRAGRLNPTW
jgi:hypothetical protein